MKSQFLWEETEWPLTMTYPTSLTSESESQCRDKSNVGSTHGWKDRQEGRRMKQRGKEKRQYDVHGLGE